MKKFIALEETALFIIGIYLFTLQPYDWWIFPLLILLPDLSMLGYLINKKIGAISYNFFHNRILGLFFIAAGIHFRSNSVLLAGTILFSHVALDRAFGYGLKYNDDFKHTHLGKLK